MTTFVTADTHFCHEKVIEFCRPQYKDWQDMNEDLVARWNSAGKPSDIVIHLGDVALCGGQEDKLRALDDVLMRLHGRIYLVMGNHDSWARLEGYFDKYAGQLERKGCILTHIPVHSSQKERYRLNIHGHMHEKVVLEDDQSPGWPEADPWYYCASVEQTDYAPVPLADIVCPVMGRL